MSLPFSAADVMGELTEIGSMAYGVKYGLGSSGGYGYIGMIGDKVVKFATHKGERKAPTTEAMRESCDQLRCKLYDLAKKVYSENNEKLENICESLGVSLEGTVSAKSLLTRKIVAKAVTKLAEDIKSSQLNGAKNVENDVWGAVRNKGPRTQADTVYAKLRETEDLAFFERDAGSLFRCGNIVFKSNARKLMVATEKVDPEKVDPEKVRQKYEEKMKDLVVRAYRGEIKSDDMFDEAKKLIGEMVKEASKGPPEPDAVKAFTVYAMSLHKAVENGRVARGKDSIPEPFLNPAERRILDAAVNDLVDSVMERFERFHACRDLDNSVHLFKVGYVNDRGALKDLICQTLYAYKTRENKALVEDLFSKSPDNSKLQNLWKGLEDVCKQDLAGGCLRSEPYGSFHADFIREITGLNIASQFTVAGQRQDLSYDQHAPFTEEENDLLKSNGLFTPYGLSVAKSMTAFIPNDAPAREEITYLMSQAAIPVTGLLALLHTKFDFGYGFGWELISNTNARVDGFTNFERQPPKYDFRLEGDEIVIAGSGAVGFNVRVVNSGFAEDHVFLPRHRMTVEMRILINQPKPKKLTDLKFTISGKCDDWRVA